MDSKTINMKQARKQYRAIYWQVVNNTVVLPDGTERTMRVTAWKAGAPGFRSWARHSLPSLFPAPLYKPTGKLAAICSR